MEISLCMIAKDEEKYLKQCLESIKDLVDEIIVVLDSRSSDATEKIAKSYGAKIEVFEWCGDFSAARNRSLELASKEWVLVIDGDEVLSEKDVQLIREKIENAPEDVMGFQIEQRNYSTDDKVWEWKKNDNCEECEGEGYFISKITRIFRNLPGIRYQYKVYEDVDPSIKEMGGKIKKTKIQVHHYGYLKGLIDEKRKTYLAAGLEQIKITPDDVKPYYEVGCIYKNTGRYDDALEIFKKCAALDENFKNPYLNIGWIYGKLGKLKEAKEALQKSVEIKPNNGNAHEQLGLVLVKGGNVDGALKSFENALKIKPTANCLQNIIVLLHKTRRKEEALEMCEKAYEITKDERFKAFAKNILGK